MFGRYGVFQVGWAKFRLWLLEKKYGEWVSDNDEALRLHDYLMEARTSKWRQIAWRNLLEMPPEERKDCWDVPYHDIMGEGGSRTLLSNKGVRYVLDQYRKDKAERRTAIVAWFGLTIAVGSLLVAMFRD